jgi:nucleotide-binding universal stress UspA family protein
MPNLVIVGYDGSPDADHAIDFVAARLGAAAAVVVTVWQSGLAAGEGAPALGAPVPPSPEEDRRLEAAARKIADAGASRARAAGLQAQPEARHGIGVEQTAEALFDIAEERDADLVVVGRRGMGVIRSAVLGSVSNSAVRDGRRPVLVVPAEEDDRGSTGAG